MMAGRPMISSASFADAARAAGGAPWTI